MTGFILIFFATIFIAFLVIRTLRAFGNWGVSNSSVVSLSLSKGQNRRHTQKGFVHAAARHDSRRVSKPKLPAGTVRKPWGW